MERNSNQTSINDIAVIDTKLGKLTVSKSGYEAEGYPGFVIELETKNKNRFRHQIAIIEVDETGDTPSLKTHVWDGISEDPIYTHISPEEIVDKFNF